MIVGLPCFMSPEPPCFSSATALFTVFYLVFFLSLSFFFLSSFLSSFLNRLKELWKQDLLHSSIIIIIVPSGQCLTRACILLRVFVFVLYPAHSAPAWVSSELSRAFRCLLKYCFLRFLCYGISSPVPPYIPFFFLILPLLWTEYCVPLELTCWKPNPQCDGFTRCFYEIASQR